MNDVIAWCGRGKIFFENVGKLCPMVGVGRPLAIQSVACMRIRRNSGASPSTYKEETPDRKFPLRLSSVWDGDAGHA